MRVLCCLLSVCGLLAAESARSMDLLASYRMALANDATFLAAIATAEASREAIPQARAGLLPVISYSNSRSHNSTTQTSLTTLGANTRDYDYLGKSEALTLRQPLLRVDRVIQYNQAQAQVAAAEATLEKDTQGLAVRLASAYFTCLLSLERLEAILAQQVAYAGQQKLAERAFAAGEASRTDIDEARARLLVVAAQEIEARGAVEEAERTLATMLGKPVHALALARLKMDNPAVKDLILSKPLNEWVQLAEDSNPELQSLRYTFEVAQAEINRSRAQHLPTADLVASHSYSNSENNTSVGNIYRTDSVGIQLSIPLFSGGHTSSTVRQAVANRERAQQQLEAALRQLRVNVTREFNALTRGEALIKANIEAAAAAQQVLISTRKGILAGTRNTIDALNAEQQLANARVEVARARIEFLLAALKLNAAAGILTEQDVARTNSWLQIP